MEEPNGRVQSVWPALQDAPPANVRRVGVSNKLTEVKSPLPACTTSTTDVIDKVSCAVSTPFWI